MFRIHSQEFDSNHHQVVVDRITLKDSEFITIYAKAPVEIYWERKGRELEFYYFGVSTKPYEITIEPRKQSAHMNDSDFGVYREQLSEHGTLVVPIRDWYARRA